MMKKKSGIVPTIIASDCKMIGNISSNGVVEIAGTVEGDIRCRSVTVHRNGRVIGNIIAENAEVGGQVSGDLRARNMKMLDTAIVTGSILYDSMEISAGAAIEADLRRVNTAEDENVIDYKENTTCELLTGAD